MNILQYMLWLSIVVFVVIGLLWDLSAYISIINCYDGYLGKVQASKHVYFAIIIKKSL